MKRQPTTERKIKADLLLPIGDIEPAQATSCFGKAWDISAKECNQCADRDTCGIIFQKVLDEKARKIEQGTGTKFLDRTCFKRVTEQVVRERVQSGDLVSKLIQVTVEVSECEDMPSVTAFLKSFISQHDWISTKDGKVWIK